MNPGFYRLFSTQESWQESLGKTDALAFLGKIQKTFPRFLDLTASGRILVITIIAHRSKQLRCDTLMSLTIDYKAQ